LGDSCLFKICFVLFGRFGETVSCVSNKATVVVGRNAKDEAGSLQADIQLLTRKKKEMERKGQGAGFVKNLELNHEREMLENNMLKLEVRFNIHLCWKRVYSNTRFSLFCNTTRRCNAIWRI